jgi:hypothetical protein
MLGSFWEGVGGKLADRWANVSAPALVFWLGGLLSWAISRGGWGHLTPLTRWLTKLSTVAQIAAVLCALLLVAGSGVVVARLTFPVLRILEGYWPRCFKVLRRVILSRIVTPAAAADIEKWEALSLKVLESPLQATAEQLAEFVRIDSRMHRRPISKTDYMPTRTGNILRASENRPLHKYGLNSAIAWPRLWLVLPDSARQELIIARASLNSAVGCVIWGLLFCFFAWWTPFALLAGLLVAGSATTVWVPNRAETFGDLVEAAFDLYRGSLYEQLRWPLPASPEMEREAGRALSEYLWRGTVFQVTLTQPPH